MNFDPFTDKELIEFRWMVYWESSRKVTKQFFDWRVKDEFLEKIYNLMSDSDSFNRWDVESEIKARGSWRERDLGAYWR